MSGAPVSAVVDVHAHFVTPSYVEAAIAAGHRHPDGMPGWPQWSPEEHLRLMDEQGIEQSVLSISSPGVHFGDDAVARVVAREVNDAAARVCAQHPDRFRFFASVPLPDVDGALAETSRALDDLGAAGIVVETNVGGRYLADPDFEPFLAELSAREAVLFVHPTSPPGSDVTALGFPRPMLEFLVDSTRSVAALVLDGSLSRNDGVRLVVSHCGAFLPLVRERLQLFADVLGAGGGDTDVAGTLRRLWYDLAGTPTPTHADTLISVVGPDHLLFGSDFCWTPAPVVARQVAALDRDWREEEHGPWRELVGRNAASLWSRG